MAELQAENEKLKKSYTGLNSMVGGNHNNNHNNNNINNSSNTNNIISHNNVLPSLGGGEMGVGMGMGSQVTCLQMLLAGTTGSHIDATLPTEVADLVRSLLAKSDAAVPDGISSNVVGSSSNQSSATKGMCMLVIL